jgi:hypothetical protein
MRIYELFEDGSAGGTGGATAGSTNSSAVPSLPGGRQKKSKQKLNLLGFAAESDKEETKVIKRKP